MKRNLVVIFSPLYAKKIDYFNFKFRIKKISVPNKNTDVFNYLCDDLIIY